jgi:hypothetical protein
MQNLDVVLTTNMLEKFASFGFKSSAGSRLASMGRDSSTTPMLMRSAKRSHCGTCLW